jgi:hypothetical protein
MFLFILNLFWKNSYVHDVASSGQNKVIENLGKVYRTEGYKYCKPTFIRERQNFARFARILESQIFLVANQVYYIVPIE